VTAARTPTDAEVRILAVLARMPYLALPEVAEPTRSLRDAVKLEGGMSLRLELVADYLERLCVVLEEFSLRYQDKEMQLGDLLADMRSVGRVVRLVWEEHSWDRERRTKERDERKGKGGGGRG
jgi:hypothetical protein